MRAIGSLLHDAGVAFMKSRPSRLAAAMSCYATFSLAPLALLTVVFAAWYGRDPDFLHRLAEPLRDLVGVQNERTIEGLFKLLGQGQIGFRSTLLGLSSVLFGASGVFVEVQGALNTIWHAPEEPSYWRTYLRQRGLTFLMLAVCGALLIASLVIFAALTMLQNFFSAFIVLPFVTLRVSHGVVSVLLLTALFALVFKVLPDVTMHWRDVLLGSLVTALLFTLGKVVMGWYLGRFLFASVYGPVSSLVALLFWIFYSCHIFLFGAHFTYIYACRYGTLAQESERHE
ncbi:MAG: YihY/virulence factor BrkB family protein [Candidatus Xenobia bacterium]